MVSHFFGSDGVVNGFVKAASEAALIGGIADWFAVTALFRHPLGIPIPHTALIPRSKDEIGRGLAEFVQQNFLDPTNLRNWLSGSDIAGRVATWLETPEHSERAARRGVQAAATAAESFDDETVAGVVTQAALDWIRQTPVTPLISLVFDAWLKGGHTQESIEAALRGMDVVLDDNLPYFKDSFDRSAPWWMPQWAGDLVFERIIASVRILIDDIVADPSHPVRADIERMLGRVADDLRNSTDLAARIEGSKLRLLDSPEWSAAIESQWKVLQEGLARAAAEPGSELEQTLAELIRWWARRGPGRRAAAGENRQLDCRDDRAPRPAMGRRGRRAHRDHCCRLGCHRDLPSSRIAIGARPPIRPYQRDDRRGVGWHRHPCPAPPHRLGQALASLDAPRPRQVTPKRSFSPLPAGPPARRTSPVRPAPAGSGWRTWRRRGRPRGD